GPLICGYLAEDISWHLGFSAAGFGMVLGLIQYKLGAKYLGTAGLLSTGETADVVAQRSRKFYLIFASIVALIGLFGFLAITGVFSVTLTGVAMGLGYGIIVLAIVFFIYLYFFGGHDEIEKKRLLVIFWLFILAAIFWSGFEQAGSSLNLFADRLTDRVIFGWEAPASWLQSINPIFIIIGAPLFGSLWVWLASHNANPSIPMKFALGLLGLSAGFFVIAWGSANSSPDNPVTPAWLVVTYFLHTCGELCLSPVGLSSITKLAPAGRVGQMMGVWFIATALGNLFAGLVAGRLEDLAPDALFGSVAMIIGLAGVVALLLYRPVKKLTSGIE
ncbi:MAG: MFS transporter, partial [Bacteroidetes bacterium]|nr:MFS transporter [Bacteroidota bacterium]